ncbi:unnamed protein product [Phytophthora fragariaefolia]|uniref:Unnamed protein product n=1 Tax=Phytophthora fragariaefolia TaxID=1490495 RepID=A0A9W6TZN1_9STRA|nr:unnamed protein product [Phytophthora fragariaefolia]
MELRMKEKEALVMDEVENVEIMRQLHVHLQKDEEMVREAEECWCLNVVALTCARWVETQVRDKVCVGAGDEQQLGELQLMLRTDFLEEVAGAGSPQKQQQVDSAASNEASLQFAWETIDDQKKEIIRLRAENEELKRLGSTSDATAVLRESFFDDEPTKVIDLLRSQLSSHHEKNLDILHDHIQRLEKALQRATATSRKSHRVWDGSKSTFDSSSRSGKEDWSSSILSRSSTVGTDFSRTQIPRKKCDECCKNASLLLTLRSEVKQLRAHASVDEESLLQAEKGRGLLQRENSALSTALMSLKQKQEDLRQAILDLTEEKHQLQNLGDSEQRTSERSIRVLKEQLDALEEQKTHQKQQFDQLLAKYDDEVSEKRTLLKQIGELQDSHSKLSQSTTELQELVNRLDGDARRCEKFMEERDLTLKILQAQLNSMENNEQSRTSELQEKEKLVAHLRAELSKTNCSMDDLEAEKRRATVESERLLQTLDECKRKNQCLEKGFEELKQGKELLRSLQEVERGASALQLDELKQTQELLESLKLDLKSTKSECDRLERELSETFRANADVRYQHNQEIDQMQHEVDAMEQQCLALEKQVKTEQSTLETAKQEYSERINELSQELAENKTAVLMWINQYNEVCEAKQKLENDALAMSEEKFNLQQMVEELQAERRATSLAHQREAEREAELRKEISSVTEQHRIMEHERRVLDQDKRALAQLVQTLQERPKLQYRAFHEMLMVCQRGTEHAFCQLSESVTVAFGKLIAVEERYQALQSRVSRFQQAHKNARSEYSSSDESVYPVVPKTAPPQIVFQENDFLNNCDSRFGESTSHPVWLQTIEFTPVAAMDITTSSCKKTASQKHSDNAQDSARRDTTLDNQLKQWKWKYFIRCLIAHSSSLETISIASQLNEASKINDQLKPKIYRCVWQKLWMKMENRELLKLNRLSLVLAKYLSNMIQQNKLEHCFTNWKNQARLHIYEAKLRASANDPLRPFFSPTTTMALANCIQLVRRFCEPARHTDKGHTKFSHGHGVDELAGCLTEINTKIASWKVSVDRKIAEYVERNTQLKSVQRRCAELKDLVGLNQRLIEEMERRFAGQQSVVEAAWDFAIAYKALSPSARAHVFQSRDFLLASKGIVEGLNSLGLPRSVNKLSQTVGITCRSSDYGSNSKVNCLSASAAPGVTSASSSLSIVATEKSRKRLNESNIELLEDAVGSLKGAMQKQRNLQLQLREKERSLSATTKELSKRSLQFLLLRSFLQWKCASMNCAHRIAPQ